MESKNLTDMSLSGLNLLGEYEPGVDEPTTLPDFKVQVSALRITGVASRPDPLARIHTLTNSYTDHA